jgi:hypothetical protein
MLGKGRYRHCRSDFFCGSGVSREAGDIGITGISAI